MNMHIFHNKIYNCVFIDQIYPFEEYIFILIPFYAAINLDSQNSIDNKHTPILRKNLTPFIITSRLDLLFASY